jgi:hypothetical protein
MSIVTGDNAIMKFVGEAASFSSCGFSSPAAQTVAMMALAGGSYETSLAQEIGPAFSVGIQRTSDIALG